VSAIDIARLRALCVPNAEGSDMDRCIAVWAEMPLVLAEVERLRALVDAYEAALPRTFRIATACPDETRAAYAAAEHGAVEGVGVEDRIPPTATESTAVPRLAPDAQTRLIHTDDSDKSAAADTGHYPAPATSTEPT
jgi:hypothetical protein